MASTILEPSRTVKKPTLEMSWDSDALFEVSQGKRVELPKLSPYSSQIAIWIYIALARYLDEHPIGTLLFETLFGIPSKNDPHKQRRPAVAFLSKRRWPMEKVAHDTDPFPAVPNLAIEVMSPTEPRYFFKADTLTAEPLLPGFMQPLPTIFRD